MLLVQQVHMHLQSASCIRVSGCVQVPVAADVRALAH